jgi:hypothetical protein
MEETNFHERKETMLENLITEEDMEIKGFSNELLPKGGYVFTALGTVSATTTEKGRRKVKVGLRPTSNLNGETVSGKIVNYKVEIDRVTHDGKSWNPAGKFLSAMGYSLEEANAILHAIDENFPSLDDIRAAEYGTLEFHPTMNGEPVTFEGRTLAANVEVATFKRDDEDTITYNSVKGFIARDKVPALAD